MQLYADKPGRRVRQVAADLAVLIGCWLAVRAGIATYRLVDRLAGPGRATESAGTDLRLAADGAGGRIDDLPVVGDTLAAPFAALADSGAALVAAGQAQQEAVAQLGLVLGLLVGGLPLLVLVALVVPPRIRWVRDAGAARALSADADGQALLATRAAATLPLHRLLAAGTTPVALAALQLDELGLVPKTPAGQASGGGDRTSNP